MRRPGVELRLGVRVTEPPAGYDLVVAADGARSALRSGARVRPYPWGALWFIGERGDLAPDMLDQVVDGTRFLAGVLPTGRTEASLFFSVPRRTGRGNAWRAASTPGARSWRAIRPPPRWPPRSTTRRSSRRPAISTSS